MKAPAFDYHRARSLDEALALLAERGGDAKVIAGGQSLLPALAMRLMAPHLLIDIGRIEGLRGIAVDDGVIRIGALTRHVDVQRSHDIARLLPMVAHAVAHIAHPAVRNRGTIGGSMANADPAAELPACAVALGARMIIARRNATHIVAAEDFFRGLYETALAPDELLVAIEFDAIGQEERSSFIELARRQGDFALVGVAAHGTVHPDRIAKLSLIYFGVGPTPVRVRRAARCLVDCPLSEAALDAAQAALATELNPLDDVHASRAVRLHLARVLLRRALAEVAPIPANAAPGRA